MDNTHSEPDAANGRRPSDPFAIAFSVRRVKTENWKVSRAQALADRVIVGMLGLDEPVTHQKVDDAEIAD